MVDMASRMTDYPSLMTSFLFNLLEKSILIRGYSYDLIDYSYEEDYKMYARSAGGILRSILYFDYSGDFLDDDGDPDSPYVVDANGEVHRKEQVELMKPIKKAIKSSETIQAVFNTTDKIA